MNNVQLFYCNGEPIPIVASDCTLSVSDNHAEQAESLAKSYSMSFDVTIQDDDLRYLITATPRFTQKEVQVMFRSIERRLCVVFVVMVRKESEEDYNPLDIVCRTPRQLRDWFRTTHHMRTNYTIKYL